MALWFEGCISTSALCLVLLNICLSATPAGAADFAINCPPGWSTDRQPPLVKRCISPRRDAFIELYRYRSSETNLNSFLNRHVSAMSRKGLPFHRIAGRSSGNVSGVPAQLRSYTGTANQTRFHAYVVASAHSGRVYVLQAILVSARYSVLQPQVRRAINSWTFPDVAAGGGRTGRPGGAPPRRWESSGKCVQYTCRGYARDCNAYCRQKGSPAHCADMCRRTTAACERACRSHTGSALLRHCSTTYFSALLGYWRAACWAQHSASHMYACLARAHPRARTAMRSQPGCEGRSPGAAPAFPRPAIGGGQTAPGKLPRSRTVTKAGGNMRVVTGRRQYRWGRNFAWGSVAPNRWGPGRIRFATPSQIILRCRTGHMEQKPPTGGFAPVRFELRTRNGARVVHRGTLVTSANYRVPPGYWEVWVHDTGRGGGWHCVWD